MALLDIRLYSKVLQLSTSITVIAPERRDADRLWPTLWLLHGLSDDHTAWTRKTSIERYVNGMDLCVVMPTADRSFYTDTAGGNRYFTYLSEELPRILGDMLPLSRQREDRYAAGLSMGGYGAFKLALSHPSRFGAAASLSGALDIAALWKACAPRIDWEERSTFENAFGSPDAFSDSAGDLRRLAEVAALRGNCPNLYMCCGTEDFLYDNNLRYLSLLQALGLPVTYEEDPGYAHAWDYWDLKIRRVLEWITTGR